MHIFFWTTEGVYNQQKDICLRDETFIQMVWGLPADLYSGSLRGAACPRECFIYRGMWSKRSAILAPVALAKP